MFQNAYQQIIRLITQQPWQTFFPNQYGKYTFDQEPDLRESTVHSFHYDFDEAKGVFVVTFLVRPSWSGTDLRIRFEDVLHYEIMCGDLPRIHEVECEEQDGCVVMRAKDFCTVCARRAIVENADEGRALTIISNAAKLWGREQHHNPARDFLASFAADESSDTEACLAQKYGDELAHDIVICKHMNDPFWQRW